MPQLPGTFGGWDGLPRTKLLDQLLAQTAAAADPAPWFQALLLKARVELGLAPVTLGEADEIPTAQQPAYEEAIRQAARKVGGKLLAEGRLPEAWSYYRLIGEPGPVAKALEETTPSLDDYEQFSELLRLALQEGANPRRGFDWVLEHHGLCNAITTASQVLYQPGPDRLHAIRRLVRALHRELSERLKADLRERGQAITEDATLPDLLTQTADLFADDNYHVDLSHLSSVVQMALELPAGAECLQAEELCQYGAKLPERFQPPSDPPFAAGYAAYRPYFAVLNRKDTDANLAYFQQQADAADEETTGAAEVLVHLLAALDRPAEALAVYRKHLAVRDPRTLACPNPIKLCQQLGSYEPLKALSAQRGDAVGYAAAVLAEALKGRSPTAE